MEDNYIIDLFWSRDENAIQLVDKKYRSTCYSIAWKILMNREDSEECVNDTWFAAWRYIPPKRPPRLVAFLGKITRGFAIDMLRKKYAVKRMDMHIVEITEEVESLNTATMYNLDEHMEAEKLIEIINDFLKSLSDRDRDIFVQRYWVMESIKNIATRHKMSEGAIKQNLLRNKRKLKKILERKEKKKANSNNDTDNAIVQEDNANAGGDIVDDTELIAVIAAAIAASENTSTDSFVVRSIRRR